MTNISIKQSLILLGKSSSLELPVTPGLLVVCCGVGCDFWVDCSSLVLRSAGEVSWAATVVSSLFNSSVDGLLAFAEIPCLVVLSVSCNWLVVLIDVVVDAVEIVDVEAGDWVEVEDWVVLDVGVDSVLVVCFINVGVVISMTVVSAIVVNFVDNWSVCEVTSPSVDIIFIVVGGCSSIEDDVE